jgi:hypothetical protein
VSHVKQHAVVHRSGMDLGASAKSGEPEKKPPSPQSSHFVCELFMNLHPSLEIIHSSSASNSTTAPLHHCPAPFDFHPLITRSAPPPHATSLPVSATSTLFSHSSAVLRLPADLLASYSRPPAKQAHQPRATLVHVHSAVLRF